MVSGDRSGIKTAFIHVGAPKTGTSVLQTFFAQNIAFLKKCGISYPSLEDLSAASRGGLSSGNAGKLARSLLDPANPSCSHREVPPETIWKSFTSALRHCGNKSLLLSSEWFFVVGNAGMKRVVDACREEGFRVRPIVYVRRQDALIASSYSQLVKRDYYTGLPEESCLALANQPTANFYRRLKDLSQLVDKDDIIVRVYEKGQLEGGDLVADVVAALGIAETDYVRPERQINPTPPAEWIDFFRRVNKFHLPGEVLDMLLEISTLMEGSATFRKSDVIPPKLAAQIVALHEEGNEKVAREFLGREDGRLFHDPMPDPEAPWEPSEIPLDKAIEALSRVAHRLYNRKGQAA